MGDTVGRWILVRRCPRRGFTVDRHVVDGAEYGGDVLDQLLPVVDAEAATLDLLRGLLDLAAESHQMVFTHVLRVLVVIVV